MLLTDLQLMKVAIWGFGVEGKATAEYLSEHNVPFCVLCRVDETNDRYDFMTDEVTSDVLSSFDVVIKSPGISPYTDLFKAADTQFTSPTALWFCNEYPKLNDATVIVVTGTKGKSTTASLLAHIISGYGMRVNLAGNIGQPLIASTTDYDVIVLEASSFQIFDGQIKAGIAVVTNLFEEHLDWHAGKENYFRDKLKVLDDAEYKIINADNVEINKRVNKEKNVRYFNHHWGYHVCGDRLKYQNQLVLSADDTALIGQHNLQNIGTVLLVCDLLLMDRKFCLESIKRFKPLAHRLQNLGKIGKHYAINDSIATTPIATIAAMQTVDLSITTLLVGGYDRGNNWCDFADELIKNPPILLILSGENSQVIYDRLQSRNASFKYVLSEDLNSAIKLAKALTVENGIILLSPGAPSFDQFGSYIERGDFFEKQLRFYED